MKRQNFQSTLVSTFKRFLLEEDTLLAIVNAYGCGYEHPAVPSRNVGKLFESVAWKDFREDVQNSHDSTRGLADELSKIRSGVISPTKLGLKVKQQYIWGDSAWDEVEEWTQVEDDGAICQNPFKVSGSRVADQNEFDDHQSGVRASFVVR